MNKSKLAITLTGLLLAQGTLSAAEQEVVNATLKQLPALKSLKDRALLKSFVEENLDQMSPETINVLGGLSVDKPVIVKEAHVFGKFDIDELATWAQN